MIYILSNLEGNNINEKLTVIKKENNDTQPYKELIIFGDIIGENECNLYNICYCLINNNIKLLLGSIDLYITTIYKYLEIDTDNQSIPSENIKDFNNGNISLDINTINYFTTNTIKWKYPFETNTELTIHNRFISLFGLLLIPDDLPDNIVKELVTFLPDCLLMLILYRIVRL